MPRYLWCWKAPATKKRQFVSGAKARPRRSLLYSGKNPAVFFSGVFSAAKSAAPVVAGCPLLSAAENIRFQRQKALRSQCSQRKKPLRMVFFSAADKILSAAKPAENGVFQRR